MSLSDWLYELWVAADTVDHFTDPNRIQTPVPPKLWTRTAITLLAVFLLFLLLVIISLIVR